MTYVYGALLCAILFVVIRRLYGRWITYKDFRAATRQQGCQASSGYPHQGFWGYDLYRERLRASKTGQAQKLYGQQFQTYGKTFEEDFLGTKTINTIEPSILQYVAALATQDFTRVEQTRRNISLKLIGPGILTTDGAPWKRARDLIKPIFSRAELSDVTILEKHVDHLLHTLPRDGRTIDAQSILMNLFLDVSSEFLLGKSLRTLGPQTPPEAQEFLQTLTDAIAGLARRRSAGKLRYFVYLFDRSYEKACSKVHTFIDRHVNQALEMTRDEKTRHEKTPTQLSSDSPQRYVFLNELAKEIRDPLDLRWQILNIFIPSRDNVAVAASNALFHLARNPGIWTELRRVALKIDQPLTFEFLKSLTLFKYVYLETLRLQGPSPRILRTAVRNTVIPMGGGYNGKSPLFVEKGTIIYCNAFCMHHDKDIWGDDAHTFRPDRWANKRPMWEFVPFSGGPRICPANQQVQTYFVYVLVRLTQAFARIENRDPEWDYVETMKLTTESKNGAQVALIPP
ncbi:MAG: hypothetical protein Q9160_002748 [Pyrenula sp. 1 TL-2023]